MLGHALQGLCQCLGGMENDLWTWPCADPLAKGVPSCPKGMHLEVTVLPAWEAGMAPVAADKERGAAANRAQSRADVGETSPSWLVSL